MPHLTSSSSSEDIRAQMGDAYDRFSAEERSLHLDLLARIRKPGDVEVVVRKGSGSRWTIVVCALDSIGVLSIIAGLLTANRIDIIDGDVFTLRLEGGLVEPRAALMRRAGLRGRRLPARRKGVRKILDIFEVNAAGEPDEAFWEVFRHDLAGLVALVAEGNADAAREKIIDRVSEAAREEREPGARLFPVAVEVDNEASLVHTEVRIRSADTPGFLFEFTNALATLNVNIERVEVRTVDNEARDSFWVTDSSGGKILSQDRLYELRVSVALIKQFTHILPRSPDPAQALRQFSALTRQILSRPDWVSDVGSLGSDAVLRTLAQLMGMSRFLWEDFLRMQHENLFPVVRDVPALERTKSKDELADEIAREMGCEASCSEATGRLNHLKDREMFRIDLRHITGRIDFEEFSYELSDLAEVVVGEAAILSHRKLKDRFGRELMADGTPAPWCILGLGKFGGREMGFASDIELIFAYDGEGATDGLERVEVARYFEEFVSTFLSTLTARQEGIFEVDLRLRPYGKAGSLATSLSGFREYFSEDGPSQHYERMALVKLRPVAGDMALGSQLIRARDGFVYSGKPIDYEDILHLRERQARELVPSGSISAKHSPGGLVDVEYFVQARQIEAGRLEPSVRVTNTMEAIGRLTGAGYLRAELAEELRRTYGLLRRLIDALRVVRGHAKDLTIPPAPSREFAYLARRLNYDSATQLEQEITSRMGFSRDLWNKLRQET